MSEKQLTRGHYVLLALYCLVLFGYSLFGGRPLTMHEARLPQTTREMYNSGSVEDWIVPRSDGRPWVERPPLPHWLTAAITAPLGGPDAVWKVRLAPALMGLLCVLLLANMTTRLFGRVNGVLAGFVQATMFEFFSYSWLVEDDIFLCAIIYGALATFLWIEFTPKYADDPQKIAINPIGWRPWPVLLLFVLLGLTNMAKGLVFGTVMSLIPIAGYLLWSFNIRWILRYVWLWGWIAFALCAAWWPVVTDWLVTGSSEVWAYDLLGRLNEGYLPAKSYYYLLQMPGIIAPWTVFAMLGLILTFKQAFLRGNKPLRFVWCWSVLTVVVFSFAQSKHHHYMLHVTGGWAVLAVFGLRWSWEKLKAVPKAFKHPIAGALIGLCGMLPLWLFMDKFSLPMHWLAVLSVFVVCSGFVLFYALRSERGVLAFGTVVLIICGVAGFAFSHIAPQTDQTLEDTAFLADVADKVPADEPVLVDAGGLASMDFFRIQFYLGERRTVLLHNHSYLQERQYIGRSVYLIDRPSSEKALKKYGVLEMILQSVRSRREEEQGGKLTLYRLAVRSDLAPVDFIPVDPMQAMSRRDGPWLKPPSEDEAEKTPDMVKDNSE